VKISNATAGGTATAMLTSAASPVMTRSVMTRPATSVVALGEALKRGQLLSPKILDPPEPLLHRFQCNRACAVDSYAGILFLDLLGDQSGLAQHPQMPAERLRTHQEAPRQLTGAPWPVHQGADYIAARPVRKREKRFTDIQGRAAVH
jgi:hypothetical protein